MKSQTKILVKVGNSSDIVFSSAKAYRAITVEELDYNLRKLENLHILVIENISEDEENSIKTSINTFISSDPENRVFFYVKDNDDTTCGIADELGFDIYLTLNELHTAIYNTMKINVSTDIEFRKKTMTSESDELGIDSVDLFGELNIDLDKKEVKVEQEEITPVKNKQEQLTKEKFPEVAVKSSPEIEKEPLKSVNIKKDTNEFNSNIQDDGPKLTIVKDKSDKVKEEIYIPDEKVIELESQVLNLRKIIETLESEKNTLVKAYKSLINSGNIIEDPVSSAEYNQVLEDKERADAQVIDLKQTIEELEDTISKLKDKVNNKDEVLDKLKDELSEFKIKYNDLQARVESGEVSASLVEEYKAKIRKLEVRMGPLNETIKNTNSTIQELSIQLENKTTQVDFEVGSRIKIMEVLYNLANEYKKSFDEIKSLKSDLNRIKSDYEKAKVQSARKDETIAEQSKKIMDLTNSEASIETKINLAVAKEKSKVEELITEKSQVETRLKLVENQLKIKEEQYNDAIKNGVGSLNSDSLESINKTLKAANGKMQAQLMDLQNKYAQLENKSRTSISNYQALEEQNKNLQGIINSSLGNTDEINLPIITYTGKAKIYAVCGTGSYGITTTAVSLVNRLQGKTLFIDLDMGTPKGDVWFQTSPIVNGVPGVASGLRSSAMSIFFDNGFSLFKEYYERIVKRNITTKSGHTDCLYGTYARPSTKRVMKADIQGLMNFLGSLYDNIVIDLGKLGSSEISDQVIKIITSISERTFFISTLSKFDINLALTKIRVLNMSLSKISWIINMSLSTSLDQALAARIKPAKIYIIPFERELWMSNKSFIQHQITKGKFSLVLEDIGILGR